MNMVPGLPGKRDRKLWNTTPRLSVIAKGNGKQKRPCLSVKNTCVIIPGLLVM